MKSRREKVRSRERSSRSLCRLFRATYNGANTLAGSARPSPRTLVDSRDVTGQTDLIARNAVRPTSIFTRRKMIRRIVVENVDILEKNRSLLDFQHRHFRPRIRRIRFSRRSTFTDIPRERVVAPVRQRFANRAIGFVERFVTKSHVIRQIRKRRSEISIRESWKLSISTVSRAIYNGVNAHRERCSRPSSRTLADRRRLA